ncbi:hypothetical protein RCS94_03135 [Orbaceae bacterium ac157xtp]
MIAPSSYGALSATSANTIKGNAPWFAGHSGAKKLGFKIGNTKYSESEGNLLPLSSGVINYVNATGLNLRDLEIMTLTTTDFDVETDYYDADGDEAHPTDVFSMGTRTHEWRDRDGTRIFYNSNANQILGCGNELKLPLTLKIKLPNVKVRSRYGNPSESLSTELVQEYKITVTGICFAKPNSTNVYSNAQWLNVSSGSSFVWNDSNVISPTRGGGYKPDYVPNKGFKASATIKFPTTGFPGAKFQLVMDGSQTDYTYTSEATPQNSVTVDTNGWVKLNSKPNGDVIIKAKLKNSNPVVEHEYTFNPTSVWALPQSGTGNYSWASNKCGGASNILTRAELTNSPVATSSNYLTPNTYTRTIGGGIFGEWGRTDSVSYPDSRWVSTVRGESQITSRYWVTDTWSNGNYVVDSFRGDIYHKRAESVACRG